MKDNLNTQSMNIEYVFSVLMLIILWCYNNYSKLSFLIDLILISACSYVADFNVTEER